MTPKFLREFDVVDDEGRREAVREYQTYAKASSGWFPASKMLMTRSGRDVTPTSEPGVFMDDTGRKLRLV